MSSPESPESLYSQLVTIAEATMQHADGFDKLPPQFKAEASTILNRQLVQRDLTATQMAKEEDLAAYLSDQTLPLDTRMVCPFGRKAQKIFFHSKHPGSYNPLMMEPEGIAMYALLLAMDELQSDEQDFSLIIVPDYEPPDNVHTYHAATKIFGRIQGINEFVDHFPQTPNENKFIARVLQAGFHAIAMSPTIEREHFRWAPHFAISVNTLKAFQSIKEETREHIIAECVIKAIRAIRTDISTETLRKILKAHGRIIHPREIIKKLPWRIRWFDKNLKNYLTEKSDPGGMFPVSKAELARSPYITFSPPTNLPESPQTDPYN